MSGIVRLILALGAIFVGGVVVSGCGSAIPSDAVASVAGNPISTQSLKHWSYVAAVGASQTSPGTPVIIPDPPNYSKCIASLKKVAPASIPQATLKNACVSQFAQTMEYLIRADWIQGQAAAQGIKLTSAQVLKQYTTAKAQQFKSEAQFQLLLKQTGETVNDILYRFRISMLSTRLATPAAIKAYYEKNISTYSTPERRSIRIVRTKTQAQAKAALKLLATHHSWQSVAKKYSIDTATKTTGGLLANIVNGQEPVALNTAVFAAPRGRLLGPIKSPFGYYVAEVTSIAPATTESLAQATPTIKSTLASNALSKPPWLSKWKAKTTCRAGFEIPDCTNYKAPKPVSTAPTPTTTATPPTATATATTPAPTTTTTTTHKKK